ncbi:sensor histidine kinase ResE [Paenibacillus sp. J31TS4]|uniref:sensor histidine kinase n=1 Tax=Paenibacillus sp. J31TS4 TaxID=2807195 RepID=UPI001B28ABCA|nr:ATP-binding protein [Paenibacillus sp. J31TS4]GIP37507.1 sensor histidine kinase ResE [Paenibacillus sp. J31TS4]
MYIFRTVVGKLWMTIIGLVAVVLLILGLFLFQYIDTSFPNANNQARILNRLADKVAEEAVLHLNEKQYFDSIKEILEAQDAGLRIVTKNEYGQGLPLFTDGQQQIKVEDVLNQGEMNQAFSGQRVNEKYAKSRLSWSVDYLVLAVPLSEQGRQVDHVLVLYQSMKSVEDTQLFVKKLFASVSMMGFLLTTFFAFFLITRITRPLMGLKKAADSITQGQYDRRVPVVTSDEIGELTQTFNLMAGQLEQTIHDLNNEKQNLGSVLHSMHDAVLSFDTEGSVIFTNTHGEELLDKWNGIEWEDGKSPAAAAPVSPGTALGGIPDPLVELYEQVLRETRGASTRIHVQKDVWSVVMAPLWAGDQVRGVVAVLRDVTEEVKLEKMRKDFVANVSHELRTPLSMLQGYSEALLDDIVSSPEERQELVQVIHDESLRMGRLVKDLLDLARMEAGHMEMTFRELDLSSMLKRVFRKFSVLCKDRGLELEMQPCGEDVVLQAADEDRLEQVLTNLLDNAIRHTSAGGKLFIRCSMAEGAKIPSVKLEIQDQGEGIPPEALPYIFERFYKADKARTRGNQTGTGLGLAIVKNIIDAHHGSITARSALGEGTTFTILLPLYAPKADGNKR